VRAYNRRAVSHSRAATALLLLLIAACTAAFIRTQQLKLEKSPVASPRVKQSISPGCTQTGCHATARISFRLRSPRRLALAIVDHDGRVVRVLERERLHRAGIVRTTWDGLAPTGIKVPDGRYELRITLPDRTITVPAPILVDTGLPSITLNRVDRGKTIRIHYTRDRGTRGFVVVLRDGKVVRTQRIYLRVAHLPTGKLAPGRYVVELVAVDAAGNRTASPPSFTVTVP
jgi:hypothetical protein